jgi:hypothetical protein
VIINALYPNIWRIISRALVQISGQYGGRVFFNVAPPEVTYPYLIYQSDSSLGYSYSMLNMSAWKGIVTMRSVSTTLASASDSLAELSNGFTGAFVVSGIANIAVPYDVQFYPYKVYSYPVERLNNAAVYTSAIGVETFITPR